jgi:hypothetical protein
MMSSPDGDRSLHPDAEVLAAWSDGALARQERVDVEAHVADCARCQLHLAAMARMAAASPEPVPHRRDVAWWRWLAPISAAAAALLVWVIVRPTPAPAPSPTQASSAAMQEQTATRALPPAPAPETPTAPVASAPPEQRTQQQGAAAGARRFDKRPAEEDKRAVRERLGQEAPTAVPPGPPASPARAESNPAFARNEAAGAADAAAGLAPQAVRVERSADGRVTWDESGGVGALITAGASPAPSIIWLVGRGGLVLLSIDGADGAWRRVAFPEPVDLTAIAATDAMHATVTTADGREFTTSDGGIRWVPGRLQDFPAAPF